MVATVKCDTIKEATASVSNLTLDSSGNVTIGNNLTVTGTTTQTGNVSFTGSASVGGNATIGGATFLPSTPASGGLALTGTVVMGSSFLRNRIINGNMVIDQRNAGASGTAIGYTVDRWSFAASLATKGTWQQNAGSITPPAGFSNYLGFTSNSSYSVLATDYFVLRQPVEGFNFADMAWGGANAQSVTVSFWVRSSLTGTFCVNFSNSAGNRAYPATYTISASNTWERKTITVAGDTTGTWIGSTNGVGLYLDFSIGVGSTYSGTANTWNAGLFLSATGATSVVGTNGATFYITGVQLEIGSVATPYEQQIYSDQLAQCQRYYQKNSQAYTYNSYATAGTNVLQNTYPFCVQMRTSPTMASSSVSYSNASGLAFLQNVDAFVAYFSVTANGNAYAQFSWTATAEL